jgi:hypothetical protein
LEDRCLPTIFTPTTFSDGGFGSGSLRDAVLQANNDPGTAPDTIQLQAGIYHLTITNFNGFHETAGLLGDLNINSTNHALVIVGAGSAGTSATMIDASQLQDRIFEINNPGTHVTFKHLILSGGLAQEDGGNGVIAGTTPAYGGAILNNVGSLTLQDVVVENSVARGGNGPAGAAGAGNGAGGNGGAAQIAFGGGIYSPGGTLTIKRSTFTNDQAVGGAGGKGGMGGRSTGPGGQGGVGGAAAGGGLYASGGVLNVSGSKFSFDQALGGVGGEGGTGGTGTPRGGMGGAAGSGGTANGGGLFVTSVVLTVAASTLSENQATGGTGGLGGFGGFGGTYFSASGGPGGPGANGGAARGAGLFAMGGSVTVTNSTFTTNMLQGGIGGAGGAGGSASFGGDGGDGGHAGAAQGGGLFLTGATLNLTASTIDHNQSMGGSGGVGGFGQGGFTTGFSGRPGNGGGGGSGQGGGLFAAGGQLTLVNATVALNTVQGGTGGMGGTEGFATGFGTGGTGGTGGTSQGGGLYIGGATIQVTNVTIAQNQALDSVGGVGGINGKNGVGSPGTGGGGFTTGPTVNSLNTIFATDKATDAADFSGLFLTANNTLLGDGSGSNLANGYNGNQVGTKSNPINPMLGPLAKNGGSTETMALLVGSPAIDAGTAAGAPTTDQRGQTRGSPPDIGGYEFTGEAAMPVVDMGHMTTAAPVGAVPPAMTAASPESKHIGDGGNHGARHNPAAATKTSARATIVRHLRPAMHSSAGVTAAALDRFFTTELQ